MELTEDQFERRTAFLNELDVITKRYGITICGCGCCDSPWLDLDADRSGRYTTDDDFWNNLKWVTE